MNNISKELKKEVENAWNEVKEGGKITFKICNVRFDKELNRHIIPNAVEVPNTDRIYDPGKDEEVDIGFVTSEKPTGPDSQKEKQVILGDIVFQKDNQGKIEFTRHQRNYNLFFYLFLSNYNESNKGKIFHKPPDMISGYRYFLIDRKNDARKNIDFIAKRNEAQEMAQAMSHGQLEEVAKGLYQDYQSLSPEEIKQRLILLAEKNPEKVLSIDKNVDVKMKAFIKDCEKEGLISKNRAQSKWEWGDNGGFLCSIKPGMSAEDSLKDYFITDQGKEVVDTLKAMMKGGNKKEETVASSEPADTKTTTKKKR